MHRLLRVQTGRKKVVIAVERSSRCAQMCLDVGLNQKLQPSKESGLCVLVREDKWSINLQLARGSVEVVCTRYCTCELTHDHYSILASH